MTMILLVEKGVGIQKYFILFLTKIFNILTCLSLREP